MLGHVFIVEDAKDLAQIVRDVTRYGGAYRPEVRRAWVDGCTVAHATRIVLTLTFTGRTYTNSYSGVAIGKRLRKLLTRQCTILILEKTLSSPKPKMTTVITLIIGAVVICALQMPPWQTEPWRLAPCIFRGNCPNRNCVAQSSASFPGANRPLIYRFTPESCWEHRRYLQPLSP
jgi:hypothetical protein